MKKFVSLGAMLVAASSLLAQGFGRGGSQGQVFDFLVDKYDKDKDGKVSAEEYTRGQGKFRRYDRDGDGFLTAADFRGGRGTRRDNADRMIMRIVGGADSDGDRSITAAEWKAFVHASDDGEGAARIDALIPENMRRRADRIRPTLLRALDRDKSGKVELAELMLAFARLDKNEDQTITADEMGRQRSRNQRSPGPARRAQSVPRRGEPAPDFDLPLADMPDKTVRLSSFTGKKPVALIFGSYT